MTEPRSKLIAGNWKMHGSKALVRELVGGILAGLEPDRSARLLVLPPYPYLSMVRDRIGEAPVLLGAQDLSRHAEGAYTGEVSGSMLAEWGASHVLVGHSERRSLHGENDALVAEKFIAAQQAGLRPILCVGETRQERRAGRTGEVIAAQVGAVVDRAGIRALAQAVIAYEPVWAIGSGQTASPAQAQEVHAAIRAQLAEEDATISSRLKILYGGSIKPDNAAELFAREDIDGGLIGGASLKAESFMAIYRAA